MKLKNNIKSIAVISLLVISACTTENSPANISSTATTASIQTDNSKYPDLELLIEQKKPSGEIIPIGSKGVQNVSIDGYDYPLSKIVQDQLQIEIPKIVPGKHELNLSLYLVNDPFSVPLIIPSSLGQKVSVLLRLTVNENTKEIQKIEYGYDLDSNGIVDPDQEKFESIGTKDFYAISTDGVRQKIDAYINASKAVPNEAVPPGVVPSSASQNQKNDTTQPQLQVPEPPQPKTNDAEIYPLPPSATGKTDDPVPVPIDDNQKTDNNLPTPEPQLPDLDNQ